MAGNRQISRLRRILVRATGAAAVAVSLQPFAAFRLPTPEFAMVLTAVGTLGAYGWAIRLVRRTNLTDGLEAFDHAVPRATFGVTVLAAMLVAALAVANGLREQCLFLDGLPLLLATWIPSTIFGAVAGASIGSLTRRRAPPLLLPVLLGVACIAHDVLQSTLGPRLLPVDPLLGDLAGASQRAGLGISELHLRQRGALLLVTLALALLARWRIARASGEVSGSGSDRRRRRLARAACLVAGLLVLLGGDAVGLGWSHRAVREQLSREFVTGPLAIRYPPDPETARDVREIAASAAWHLHELRELWGVDPSRRVTIYVFADETTLRRLAVGAHATPYALYLTRRMATGPTLGHELVHAVNVSWRPSPRVLLSRGLLEGVATAYDGHYSRLPEAHELEAAALDAGTLPRATEFMGYRGLEQVYERAGYRAAGSFVGFLILEYGFDRFVELERTLDYEQAYGTNLVGLDLLWREFLARVPRRRDAAYRALGFFSPELRGYLARGCPKLGRARTAASRRAFEAFDLEDYGRAYRIFRELGRDEGDARWNGWALVCLERADRIDEGLALVDELLSAPGLAGSERAGLLYRKTRLLLRARAWDDADALLEQRGREGLLRDGWEALEARLVGDPALREGLARTLTISPRDDRRDAWERLLAESPESPGLALLFVHRALGGSGEPQRRFRILKRAHPLDPATAQLAAEEWRRLGNDLRRAGEFDEAREAFTAAAESSEDPRDRFLATRGLDRLAFERREFPGEPELPVQEPRP